MTLRNQLKVWASIAPKADGYWKTFQVGDRVTILNPHDPMHATGTIQIVTGESPYGVLIDGMEEMGVHKWYTTEEIEPEGAQKGQEGSDAKKKKHDKMKMKGRPPLIKTSGDRKIAALTMPSVLDKWSDDAAGVRALSTGDATITMFDIIGEDFWSGGGITAKSVAAQLRAIGDRPIEVQINSPGGDMFEGIAIYNVLREHPQPITVKVMGMAASAASIIAMAGDTVEIGAASFLMIHNCWVVAMGNRHDMAETSTWLEPFDQAMADVYAARTGRTPAQIAQWMDDETYMSGSVAVDRGFADAMLPADQVTVDDKTKASDRDANSLRSLELTLVSAGMTRTQARERIKEIKGTPGAAVEATPGAGDPELTGALAGLLETLRA